MNSRHLDRTQLDFYPLAERDNRVDIESASVHPGDSPGELPKEVEDVIQKLTERIKEAHADGRPVVLAFGAHTIKNGLAPILIHLMKDGWVSHLATNGAGIIHDWEFSFLGETSEHVERNTSRGQFGMWEETGKYLNLALLVGAYRGLGYGESVGSMINEEGLDVPTRQELKAEIQHDIEQSPTPPRAAAAADLLRVLETTDLDSGRMNISHPYKQYSAQAAARRCGVPFTSHPMFGHDIIYLHPYNYGAAIGRAAQRDFLDYAEAISRLTDGVYISVGSAVMSPMIFEKSMSMAQNLAHQNGDAIENHFIAVNDIQESSWDWSQGEPPEDHPDYYLRFYKTFHRMGGDLHYAQCDNRDFLLTLCRKLNN